MPNFLENGFRETMDSEPKGVFHAEFHTGLCKNATRWERGVENPEVGGGHKEGHEMRFGVRGTLPDPDPVATQEWICLLYTSPSPRDQRGSRMPSSA